MDETIEATSKARQGETPAVEDVTVAQLANSLVLAKRVGEHIHTSIFGTRVQGTVSFKS